MNAEITWNKMWLNNLFWLSKFFLGTFADLTGSFESNDSFVNKTYNMQHVTCFCALCYHQSNIIPKLTPAPRIFLYLPKFTWNDFLTQCWKKELLQKHRLWEEVIWRKKLYFEYFWHFLFFCSTAIWSNCFRHRGSTLGASNSA